MAIEHSEVKVRAAIRMGGENGFRLETPYVKSFNVKRARGQMSASFSASLKVRTDQLDKLKTDMLGNKFEIWAGNINNDEARVQEERLSELFTKNSSYLIESIEGGYMSGMRKIFTGYVLRINFSPCREDAEFIFMNVSGQDVFYSLEHKKFTRRARPSSLEMWGAITSVVRQTANFDVQFPEKVTSSTSKLTTHAPDFFKRSTDKLPEDKSSPSPSVGGAGGIIATNKGQSEDGE